ncbi:MAG: ATPase [Alphaproteobacteria bacterium]|nr:ATPase [Alphaproteobacteria bacterium]
MKRAYANAEAIGSPGGHSVALDGKPLRTPGKRPLVVPTAALAEAIAEEWNAQHQEVRPATMPLMRLAATALDRVAAEHDKIAAEVANYAGTDLVCYRADQPPALASRQHAVWQPLIDWAMLRYDAPLVVTSGVIPAAQPNASLRTFAAVVSEFDDFRLAGMQALTGACGSLIVALAVLEGRIGAEAAFAVSQLDESFQIEAWGEDEEAAERRRALRADIAATALFLALLRP